MNADQFSSLITIGILSGIIGGRVLYFLGQPNSLQSVYSWIAVWEGGFSVLGSIIAILISTIIFLRYNQITLFPFLDIVATHAPLLQSIARVGCFFAGCCYGAQTDLPWAVTYSSTLSSTPVCTPLHPTQLYSSFVLFLIFIFLRKYRSNGANINGQIAALYLILMSIERFSMDFLRADIQHLDPWPLSIVTFQQLISLSIFLAAATWLVYITILSEQHEHI